MAADIGDNGWKPTLIWQLFNSFSLKETLSAAIIIEVVCLCTQERKQLHIIHSDLSLSLECNYMHIDDNWHVGQGKFLYWWTIQTHCTFSRVVFIKIEIGLWGEGWSALMRLVSSRILHTKKSILRAWVSSWHLCYLDSKRCCKQLLGTGSHWAWIR